MDWLSIVLAIALAAVGWYSESKKKKKQAENKNSAKPNTAQERVNSRQKTTHHRQAERPYHPYAESPKDKGMSLDDFRRKFEQSVPKAEDVIREVRRMAADGVEGASMEGKPTIPKPTHQHSKQKPQKQAPPKSAKKTKPQVTVNAVLNDQKDKKPTVTVTVTPAPDLQVTKPQTNGAYDRAAAIMTNRKYTPMQQAFLWSEILGSPKSKKF